MNIIQPILRILMYCGIIYIIIRFIWDLKTIANYIRNKRTEIKNNDKN